MGKIVTLSILQKLSTGERWGGAWNLLGTPISSRSSVKMLVAVMSDSFVTPRTIPLSVGFSWQEYWSGLPFPSPGDLPDPGIEPTSPVLLGVLLRCHCPCQAPEPTCHSGATPLPPGAQIRNEPERTVHNRMPCLPGVLSLQTPTRWAPSLFRIAHNSCFLDAFCTSIFFNAPKAAPRL